MTSLNGLNNLDSVGGNLEIINSAITDLNGLEQLKFVGIRLAIGNNDELIDLSGIESLNKIGTDLDVFYNNSLLSLSGPEELSTIGGHINISNNQSLVGLSGLSNLQSISGFIQIRNNDELESLSGLDNIDPGTISSLHIHNNNALSGCEVQSICNYLLSPNGQVDIYRNGSGCDNPYEVANACGYVLPCLPYGNYYLSSQFEVNNFQNYYVDCFDLEGSITISANTINNLGPLIVITSIAGELIIKNNYDLDSLTGLDNLDSIGTNLTIYNNSDLNDLSGIGNLSYIGGNINIENNQYLSSLTGIDTINLFGINNLKIIDNTHLSTCDVQSICDFLANPSCDYTIENNALGCENQYQVLESCEALSIKDHKQKQKIKVYPNPSSNEIFIACSNKTKIIQVKVYNNLGQVVYKAQGLSGPIDISGLYPGMYVVEVFTENFRIREKLIISN